MFPDGASPQRPAQETQHDRRRGRVTLLHLEMKTAEIKTCKKLNTVLQNCDIIKNMRGDMSGKKQLNTSAAVYVLEKVFCVSWQVSSDPP